MSRLERFWRWCKRNPRVASLSAAVGALAVVAVTTLAVMIVGAARERQAVAEAGRNAELRLHQARQELSGGNYRRALDLLSWSDPLLEGKAALTSIRADWETLSAQANLYAEFKKRIDQLRYDGLFDWQDKQQQVQQHCREFLQFYDALEQRRDRAACGLPELSAQERQLFHEDVFDAFLIASDIEVLVGSAPNDPATRQAAARQVIAWLDRAEKLLPPTKALFVRRSAAWKTLGDADAAARDSARGKALTLSSAADHFWHGTLERQRGEAALKQKNGKEALVHFDKAIAAYAAVLRIRADHFWAYFDWAACHVRINRLPGALVAYTVCTQLKPEVPWPYYNRGVVHKELKQTAEALQDYDKALALNPDYAEACLGRAAIHFQRGAFAQARQDYDTVIRLQPRQPSAYLFRGYANFRLRDFDAALADFTELTRLQPKNPEPYRRIGTIHLGRRDYDQARAALNKALGLNPNFAEAYAARAQVLRCEGKPAEALADLNVVLEKLAPNDADFFNDRGDVFRMMGRLDDAAADYQRSLQLKPKQTDAYIGLALVDEKQTKPEQARDCYERMVATNPEAPEAYLRRAEYRRNRGQFAEASADCARAAKLDPKSTLPGLVQASIHAAQGEHSRAIADAENLLKNAPAADGHAHYAAACVWSLASRAAATRDDKEQARRCADRALEHLAEALGKCFHDLNYQEHNRIADDPALAPLHQHARFRELVPLFRQP